MSMVPSPSPIVDLYCRPDEGVIEYDNRDDYERALDRSKAPNFEAFKLRIDPAPPREDRDRSPPRRRDDSPPHRRRDDSREHPATARTAANLSPSATADTTAESPLPPRDDEDAPRVRDD